MSDRFPLLALDLASKTGWALAAHPDAKPLSGSKRFNDGGEPLGRWLLRYWSWLNDMRAVHRVAAVVYEAPIDTAGQTTAQVLEVLRGLVSVTALWAEMAGVPCQPAHLSSIRASFCAPGWRGDPKKAVMEACRMRGWEPTDHNAGDALALLAHKAAQYAPRGSLGMPALLRVGA